MSTFTSGSCTLSSPREPIDIVGFEKRRRLVHVGARESPAAAESHQLEPGPSRRRRRRPEEQSERLTDQLAHRRAGFRRSLLDLGEDPIVKRDGGPHDARSYHGYISASLRRSARTTWIGPIHCT